MKKLIIASVAAAALAPLAFAGHGIEISRIAGVYKSQAQNEALDILEIVKTSPREAYIRTHLEFSDGHACDVQGIARQEQGQLVYRPKNSDLKGVCALTLTVEQGKIVFHDPQRGCSQNYCAAAGSFDGESFPLSARQPIRYMKQLRSSWEFKAARAERTGHP